MKDFNGEITYKDKTYKIVFNLNVMGEIQDEYGSINRWAELTDMAGEEPNAKAVIYGFTKMLNEGIDISNEENGTHDQPLTLKQVGRMITDIGLAAATSALNDTVIEATKSDQKNA